jgi:hypothetical protein
MGFAMNTRRQKRSSTRRSVQRGVTLIETMIAAFILLVGVTGILSLFTVAVSTNSGQGDIATRTAMYAQDKTEQLMALSFNDATSDTTVYPTSSTGGTGLGGIMAGNATVGGLNPASPVTNYVDYLNSNGNQQATSSDASYMRQWTILTNSSANLKTITVLTTVLNWTGKGLAPSTRLVCTKSNTQ